MKRRPTTQDGSWFLDLFTRAQLDLDPSYQRRSVWTVKDRRFFLDTVFKNYPSPAIFLHKTTDDSGKSIYHVVDGKQRLETIIDFTKDKIRLDSDIGDVTLAGKVWSNLDESQKQRLWDYVFTVEMVGTVESAFVDEVFARVNRNSRKLEPQELRHAKYDGWFITTAEREAEREEWRQLKVATTPRTRRMKDVQFVSELMLVVLDRQLRGFDQDDLDKAYATYDAPQETAADFSEEDFTTHFEAARRYLLDLETANQCVTDFAKSLTHLYSLWTVVALHHEHLRLAEDAAPRYAAFMTAVNELAARRKTGESVNVEGLKTAAIDDVPTAAIERYQANSLGANTELPQRQERLASLVPVLAKRSE